MRTTFFTATALCLAMAGPLAAKPIPDGGVTVQDVAGVLQADGYKAEISKDNVGDPMIISGAGGKTFLVLFFGCEKDRCTSYQMSAGFATDAKPSLDKVNSWNSDHRFGRVYLDKDKDPILEMDIDAEKGFTTEAISNNLATWVAVLDGFRKDFGL